MFMKRWHITGTGPEYDLLCLLPEDEQSGFDLLGVAILCVCLTTTATAMIVLMFHQHPRLIPAGVLVLKSYLWLLPVSVFGGCGSPLMHFLWVFAVRIEKTSRRIVDDSLAMTEAGVVE